MKRRTTITLTIAGLLGLTGIFYAANPSPFGSVPGVPIGVTAAPTDLFATEYCTKNIDSIACDGTVSLYGTIPAPPSGCKEMYMAMAPLVSASATPAPFTPRDVFVTLGPQIWQIRPPNPPTLFSVIPDPGCANDHTGITFDHVGTFDHNMIVTCHNGGDVWKVNGAGVPTFIASTGATLEGPAVVPLSFGPFGGQILAPDEFTALIWAISNTGVVTLFPVSHSGAESVQVIPTNPCTFCGKAHFQAIGNFPFPTDNIYAYPPADFAGLGGGILVTSESGSGTIAITFVGGNYVTTSFDNIPGGVFEGSSFVDCDVPSPTPTPTATFTPIPTATATATATATPTPTATPTATVCPRSRCYWKNNPNAWPVNTLMLGSKTYTKAELLNILNHPDSHDASVILALQLIAAKLNIAAGSDPAPVSSTITHADGLLAGFSGKLPYHVNPNSNTGRMMVSDANMLGRYNDGKLTHGCCHGGGDDDDDGPRHSNSGHGHDSCGDDDGVRHDPCGGGDGDDDGPRRH